MFYFQNSREERKSPKKKEERKRCVLILLDQMAKIKVERSFFFLFCVLNQFRVFFVDLKINFLRL